MKILYAIILFIHPIISFSQNPKAQDPAAEPYLNTISGLFKSENAIQIEFRYEVVSRTDNTTTDDYGSVIIKGQKYKLAIEDGEMYFNGRNLWVYNKSAEEVYSSIPSKGNSKQLFIDPFTLLSDYRKNFKYRLKDDVSINGRKYANIELYPNETGSNYSILRLVVDKPNSQIYSLEYQQKNGITYKIYITELINPVKVSDSAFTWDQSTHPGVLEVEM